jgi:hypothetical protein
LVGRVYFMSFGTTLLFMPVFKRGQTTKVPSCSLIEISTLLSINECLCACFADPLALSRDTPVPQLFERGGAVSSMAVSKEIVGYWSKMAVEGDKPSATDAFCRERGMRPRSSHDHNASPRYELRKRSLWAYPRLVPSLCFVLALLHFIYHDADHGLLVQHRRFNQRSTAQASASASKVLDIFQVYAPVAVNGDGDNGEDCTMLLMEHSFGYSYGKPFVGTLTIVFPPLHLTH